jgi:hypothetical protein
MRWSRFWSKDEPVRLSLEPSEAIKLPGDSQRELRADEATVESVARFREEMERAREKMTAEHNASLAEARSRIAYAESFVEKTGLDSALVVLLDEMWHWPAWSERFTAEEFRKARNLQPEGLTCEEEEGEKATVRRVEFIYANEHYRFELEQGMHFDGGTSCNMRLYTGSRQLLSAHMDREYDDYGGVWRYRSVDRLEIGSWVGHVVEMKEQVWTAERRHHLESEAKWIQDQARGLPEPD